MTIMTRRSALASGSGLVGASLLPRAAFAQATKEASMAFGPATAVYAASQVADEKGFFKAEGLTYKLIAGNAGTHGRQTLAAGQALYAHGDASHALQLTTRGKPCKIIMATQMVASTSTIVVRKDLFDAGITTPEKLAAYKRPDGTKPVVAATAIGSGTWMYGTYVFESKGLGDKINWVAGGGLKTMLPGLETKQFDAIMTVPSWVVEAEAKGFGKVLYSATDKAAFQGVFGGNVPVLVVYTLAETTKDEKDRTQAFVNGMYQAIKYMKTAPVAELQALIGKKYYDGIDEPSLRAELVFDRETWDYTGRISKEDFERGGKVWYRQGTDIPPAKFEDIVDMSFLDAAQKKFG